MVSSKDFFEKVIEVIDKVSEAERENIYKAAQMMGDCMDENGVVQLFGLGHGLEFSMELGYRAGGLMPFHKVQTRDLALRGVISEEELFDFIFPWVGVTAFASEEQHGTNYNDYNGSIVEEYVNDYAELLESKFDVEIEEARLITYEDHMGNSAAESGLDEELYRLPIHDTLVQVFEQRLLWVFKYSYSILTISAN